MTSAPTFTIDADPLLGEIELAMDVHGISATKFGYMACGDPAIVGRMRSGLRPYAKRRERLVAALKKLNETGDLL